MKNNHIEGIDYLRVVMSLFVVLWHMGGGGQSLIYSKTNYAQHVFTTSDFINFHMLLLTVPMFIFISVYLYVMEGASTSGLKKRVKRILILLTFWPVAFILSQEGYPGLARIIPRSIGSFAVIILTAGGTVFFYFVSQLICLLVAFFIAKLDAWHQLMGFLASIVVLTYLPGVTKLTGFFPLTACWSPLSFISLPFAAVLVAQNKDYINANIKKIMGASIILSILFAIFEWRYSTGAIFLLEDYAIPAYARTSLLFEVLAIFIVTISLGVKSGNIVRRMAKYSLALYCVHPFLTRPLILLSNSLSLNHTVLVCGRIIVVIVLSYALAAVLRIFLKDEVIV